MDSPQSTPITITSDEEGTTHIDPQNPSLLHQLESLRSTHHALESQYSESETKWEQTQLENTLLLSTIKEFARRVDEERREKEGFERRVEVALRENDELMREIEGFRVEREGFEKRIEVGLKKKEELVREIEGLRDRVLVVEDERRALVEGFEKGLEGIKGVVMRLVEGFDEDNAVERGEKDEEGLDNGDGSKGIDTKANGLDEVIGMLKRVEGRMSQYKEKVRKEKKELESSVVSLTEENRDTNSLLRISLVEKEAVEKSLNKLKGNSDQKRVALLQIAERGLQKVGFGFMMGGVPNEVASVENASSTASIVSDSSECEEDVVSLASTVEKIMKNLRHEISQLRRSLEESRSDIERLQNLSEKQAQQISEQSLYIKELEDRETILTQNVEELLMEMKATEEEVDRWREACELEAEAGKNVVEERDQLTNILKQELDKKRAALEVANSKLKLKEELAAAAMAAQEAAEKSLQLADSRTTGLHQRIEELTRQLEEAESRERNSRRGIRRICWPWQPIRLNPAADATAKVNVRRLLPEMQSLLSV
ncbi:hypothetical protein Droror1_Dr00013205 [Drosera rotundifolia]